MNLKTKIKNKTAKIAVIGQGYVGLPLSLLINQSGFFVWAIDKDKSKIKALKASRAYIDDIQDNEIATALETKKFKPTTSFNVLNQANVIIIAVPTPLDEYKVPDLSYIKNAVNEIAKHLSLEQLIILESTTYPGTTKEVILPILQKKSQKNNNLTIKQGSHNFYLAFSPERVDPGNQKYNTKNTPKVVGGINKKSTDIATLFYQQIIDQVVPVSSAKTAEMTKLLENIFRIVNISMINELALLCGKLDIDIWEVIKAASTKPFGFMPFYPGPGVGGHCISVDPFYLSYKAKQHGFFTRFIDLAGEINELMPHYLLTMTATALNYTQAKAIKNSKILIMGISYKKDIKDTRESASYKIMEILHKKGAKLYFFDPYIDKCQISNVKCKKLKKINKSIIKNFDAVIILTDHSNIDYELIAKNAKTVIDTRNVIKSRIYDNIYRL